MDNKHIKTVETVFGELRDEGGDVRYKKEDGSNNVDVLLIQTREMKGKLARINTVHTSLPQQHL